jgi:MFS family permease
MINILLLGLVSFFSDVSSEMVYPLIPLYLTSAFGATPGLVGIIEGIAESAASLLKVFSGYVSDKYKSKKPIAFAGYGTSLIYKLALLIAGSWPGILAARVIDRVGKGIRTAPRDVLVSESAEASRSGQAFGLHKAMDMAGSALGIFLSYLLLKYGRGEFKRVFLISAIPAALGLAVLLFVKEKREKKERRERIPFWKNLSGLDRNLKLYLLVAFLFTLGNSSNTFLLLKAKNVGFNDTSVILLYFAYNLTASILAYPLGKLSDRVGRKKLLVAGYLVFSAVYLGFAVAGSKDAIAAVFVIYGLYTALTAGVERAFITDIAPPELKGTMLGLHSTVVGIALLPASVIAGWIWDLFGPKAPFFFGSFLSLCAAAVLMLFLNKGKAPMSAEGKNG